MPNLVLGELKYPLRIKEFHEALAILDVIEELESEGMVGDILFRHIKEKLRSKYNMQIHPTLIWELHSLGFLSYTKRFFRSASAHGHYVYSFRWRINKGAKFTKEDIKASWDAFQEKYKKEEEDKKTDG